MKKYFHIPKNDDLSIFFELLKISGVKATSVVVSSIPAILLIVFSTYAVALLFPLAHGIINNDFTLVTKLPITSQFLTFFPDIQHSYFGMLLLIGILLYVITIIKSALRYYAQVLSQKEAKKAVITIRQKFFNTCLESDKGFFDKNNVSDVYHLFNRTNNIVLAQFRLMQKSIIYTLLSTTYFGMLVFIEWKLATVALLIFPLTILFNKNIITTIKNKVQELEQQTTNLNRNVLGIFYCLPIVQGFSKQQEEVRAFDTLNQQESENEFQRQNLLNVIEPLKDLTTTTAILCIAISIAVFTSVFSSTSTVSLLLFFYVSVQLIHSVNMVSSARVDFANIINGIREVTELLSNKSTHIVTSGTRIFESINTGINIRNLHFSYNNTDTVLRNVSFSIPKGKITAIVGKNGSGKSTISNLLLRLYECPDNTIFIDDVDIKEFDIASLRNSISFVYQDKLLFERSISENISYPNPMLDTETFSKEIRILDFIEKFPDSLETKVENHGHNLSGGERQKIVIARALSKTHQLLILDEATSNLDYQTEKEVVDIILNNSKDTTIILITHNKHLMDLADNVVNLDEINTLK